MPPPYGPAPFPDKPVAKAHPSFQGVHSLVISSGNVENKENRNENQAGNQQNSDKFSRFSSNHLAIPLSDISPTPVFL